MSITLYRKYRPKNFAEIIDQNHIKITLQRAVATGKTSHAYLFNGPRGIGKTTTARVLAKALNCLSPHDGEPCNECELCQLVNHGKFLDLVELDAASRRKIEEIKEFKEHIKYPPQQGKYKIFIIDEVQMLTDVSFNALLKTIEEPPEFAVFILCTTAINKIPETIISRCQRYDFKKIPLKEIINSLQKITSQEKINVDNEILRTIAELSEGCLRDAHSLLGQVLALGDKKITWEEASIMLPRSNQNLLVKFWLYLTSNQTNEAISLLHQLHEEGADLVYFFDQFLELLRRLLLYRVDKKLDELKNYLTPDLYDEVKKRVVNLPLQQLIKMLDLFISRRQQLKSIDKPHFLLELAVVELHLSGDNQARQAPTTPLKPISPPIPNDQAKSNRPSANLSNSNNSSASLINLSSQQRDEFISQLAEKNYSLSGILKTSLLKIGNNNLQVTVKHNFHAEQIKKSRNLEFINEICQNVFGHKVQVDVIVDTTAQFNQEKNDEQPIGDLSENYVDNIIKTFGGRVVESGVVEE